MLLLFYFFHWGFLLRFSLARFTRFFPTFFFNGFFLRCVFNGVFPGFFVLNTWLFFCVRVSLFYVCFSVFDDMEKLCKFVSPFVSVLCM